MYNIKNKKWDQYPRNNKGFCDAIRNRRLEDKINQYFVSTDYADTLLLFQFNRFRQVYLFTETYLNSTGVRVKYFDKIIYNIDDYVKEMNKTIDTYNMVIESLIELDDLTDTSIITGFIRNACQEQIEKIIMLASIKYNTDLIYKEGELKYGI